MGGGIQSGQLAKAVDVLGIRKRMSWTDKWHTMAVVLANVGVGGVVCWDGRNYLYCLNGNNTLTFYRYDINSNSWSAMTPITAGTMNVIEGSSICWDGANLLYIIKGRNDYYSYSISANSFSALNTTAISGWAGGTYPNTKGNPASLIYNGGNIVYGLLGFGIDEGESLYGLGLYLYAYSISGNIWTPIGAGIIEESVFSGLTSAQVETALDNGIGCSMIYDGSDNLYFTRGYGTTTFIKYNISGNTRTVLTVLPAGVYYGSSLFYDNGDFIYCIRGQGTTTVYRYSIKNNSWDTLTGVTLATIEKGGCGCYAGNSHAYYLRGNVGTTFYRYTL